MGYGSQALRDKHGEQAVRLFDLIGFNSQAHRLTINNVSLNPNLSLNRILDINNFWQDGNGIDSSTNALNELIQGLEPMAMARVVTTIAEVSPRIRNSSIFRIASFINNPRLEIFGYVQNNGDLNASHISFNGAMENLRNDIRNCITNHNLPVSVINELKYLFISNYDGLDIQPVIRQAYLDAIEHPPQIIVTNAFQANYVAEQTEAHISRYRTEMRELKIDSTVDNRTFSEKCLALWEQFSRPVRSAPPQELPQAFFFDYERRNGISYSQNVENILNNYSSLNANQLIRQLATNQNILGLEKLQINNITNHQVLTFCYTDVTNRQSMPVYLIGGQTPNGQYFFIDPATGREYRGSNVDNIRRDFVENNNFEAYGRLDYRDSANQLHNEIIPQTAGKRLRGLLNSSSMIVGTIACAAMIVASASGGPATLAAATYTGYAALGVFTASLVANSANVYDRWSNGEQIPAREIINLAGEGALLLGGPAAGYLRGLRTVLPRGIRATQIQQALRIRNMANQLYPVARSIEGFGIAVTSLNMSEQMIQGFINQDPAAALAAIQAAMMLAVATRVGNISQQRTLTRAEERFYGFRPGESARNFVERMRNQAINIKNSIMERPIINSINKNLSNQPEFSEILTAFSRNRNITNEVQRLLTYSGGRNLVFDVLNRSHSRATQQQVRAIEERLIGEGRSILFTDRRNLFNVENGINRLNDFTNNVIQNNEIARITVNRSTGRFNQNDLITINNFRQRLQTQVAPEIRREINNIIDTLGNRATVYRSLSTVRVKGVDSLLGKIQNGRPLGSVTDLIGGRIIVDNYSDIVQVMRAVEQHFGRENILEINNFFVNPRGNSPYRAVHYVIRLNDNTCFELQIKTRSELIFGEIDHDSVYKPRLYNFNESIRNEVTNRYWGMQYEELNGLLNSQ